MCRGFEPHRPHQLTGRRLAFSLSWHPFPKSGREEGGALFAPVLQWSSLARIHGVSVEFDDGDRARMSANDNKGFRMLARAD